MEKNPLISVITPTHKPTYIPDIHKCLDAQTYSNWEWIILPNNNCQMPVLNDPRVKVHRDVHEFSGLNVGALKKKAAALANGVIILELDHDDFLDPRALEMVAKAFVEEDADFVYTDFAEFHEGTHAPHIYNVAYGWRYRPVQGPDGRTYQAAFSPPARPPWICDITHAPNHVRAWKKTSYEQVGGHDPALEVGDDYDLVLRCYLAGMKFVHIPECLYYYRFLPAGQNTHRVKNDRIQEVVRERYDQHLLNMCLTWCAKDGLLALDLGSAHNKPGEQWHGVDMEEGPGVDTVADLSERWPFEDNSVGVIRAVDFVEHMPAGKEIHFFNEAWRVLAHGGMLLIEVPSTDGRGAFQDPTHTCHGEDTEVLTIEGFKLFSDLDGTEKVWTMNPETEEAEISEIDEVHEHDFDGQLISFSGRNVDCLVTPNHRMFVGSSDETTPMRFVEAEEVAERKSCSRIPHQVIFHGATPEYFEVPDSKLRLLSNPQKGFSQDTLRLPMREFVRFLGWYISEGYTTIKTNGDDGAGNYYRIGICQSEKSNVVKYEMIGDTIRSLGFEPFRDEFGWYFSCKPLALWLARLGHSHQKYIPRMILDLDPSLLQELVEGLSLGDGSLQGTGFAYGTVSSQLASDVFELGIKLGYRVTWSKETRVGKQVLVNPDYRAKYDMHLIYFSRSKARYINKASRIPYTGKVYCVTARKNHIICTRRNGKMVWSGNSFLNENSFWYYTQDSHKRFLNGKFKGSFGAKKILTYAPGGPGSFCDQHKIIYVRAHLVAHKDPNAFPIPMPFPSL